MGALYPAVASYLRDVASDVLGALPNGPDRVSVGGSGQTQRSEFVVRELPSSADFSDPVSSRPSMGHGRYYAPLTVEYEVAVEMWSTRASLEDASSDVALWLELFSTAVARDRTLGGLCDHARPFFTSGGTARRDAQFIAAIDAGVRLTARLAPLE